MTSRSNAHRKAVEPGENSTARGSNAPPSYTRWEGRGKSSRNHAPGLDPAASSAEVNPVHETDGAAVAVCFDKKGFARFLGLSVRSLDRINAEGRLPAPDFVLGRSARWSPWTVRKWLQSRPRLPGRKGADHG